MITSILLMVHMKIFHWYFEILLTNIVLSSQSLLGALTRKTNGLTAKLELCKENDVQPNVLGRNTLLIIV